MCAAQVWSVRIEVHVLDNGGNSIDAASIACLAALLHFRRADVTVAGDVVTVHSFQDRAPVPLSIHHTPVSVTFGVLGDGSGVMIDPTVREELVMEGRIVISVNAHAELCGVHKIGTKLVQLLGCVRAGMGCGALPDCARRRVCPVCNTGHGLRAAGCCEGQGAAESHHRLGRSACECSLAVLLAFLLIAVDALVSTGGSCICGNEPVAP